MTAATLRGTPTYGTAVGSGATSASGALPTGVVEGDTLYAAVLVLQGSNNGTTISNETGWTEVAVKQDTANPRFIQRIFSKTAGASEGNPTFDWTDALGNNPEAVVAMVAFQGPCSIAAQAQNYFGNTNAPTVPTLTMSAQDVYLWCISHMSRGSTNNSSNPSGFSELAEVNGTNLWSVIFGKTSSIANPGGESWNMNNGGAFADFAFAIIETPPVGIDVLLLGGL